MNGIVDYGSSKAARPLAALPLAGEPLDELFAALLVDADATADPTQAVGYLNYLNPNVPLSPFITEYQPIQQQRPKLRRVLIRDTTGTWDLCNGAGTPLTPGWHQVTLLTTDRPWFSVQDPIDPTAPPPYTNV